MCTKNNLKDSIYVAITDENSEIINANIQVTEGNLPLILYWPMTDMTDRIATFTIGNYLPPT